MTTKTLKGSATPTLPSLAELQSEKAGLDARVRQAVLAQDRAAIASLKHRLSTIDTDIAVAAGLAKMDAARKRLEDLEAQLTAIKDEQPALAAEVERLRSVWAQHTQSAREAHLAFLRKQTELRMGQSRAESLVPDIETARAAFESAVAAVQS